MSEVDRHKIYHAFGLPPWVMENGWPLRRRLWWRIRHPRRWWRVALENHRAKKNAPRPEDTEGAQ